MYIIAVGVFVSLAMALLLYGLGRILEPVAAVDDRIESLIKDYRAGADAKEEAGGKLMARIDRGIARQGFAAQMATDLARADLALTVGEYIVVRVVLVVAAVLAGYLIGHSLISAAAAGVGAYFLPILYVRSRQGRRRHAFDAQLPDVLDHLVGSLRAGYGLMQAIEWVARQVPPPAGEEFDRMIREVQLGRGLMDAMDSAVRRIASDDLALIVTAIKIHHEVGGGLAEILATVAETIRERVRVLREIQVLTAQQRYSGYVLLLLPIGLAFVLFLMNPEYESQLFAPGPTLCIPIVAAFMMIVGFFVMRRIVEIEV